MDEQKQNTPETIEDHLAVISDFLARIAHALEYIAGKNDPNFQTEEYKARLDRSNMATRIGEDS
jgi:archaellum biogenesis protein FlaJ (TadC family)